MNCWSHACIYVYIYIYIYIYIYGSGWMERIGAQAQGWAQRVGVGGSGRGGDGIISTSVILDILKVFLNNS